MNVLKRSYIYKFIRALFSYIAVVVAFTINSNCLYAQNQSDTSKTNKYDVKSIRIGPARLSSLSHGNGKYVAVGTVEIYLDRESYNSENKRYTNIGLIVNSEDGKRWEIINCNKCSGFRGVVFGKGKFVAVGRKGQIFSSVNGANWHKEASPTNRTLSDIHFGKNRFVAVGSNHTVIFSKDGVNWSLANSTDTWGLRSVTSNSTRFVAVGDDPNSIIASDNGIDWSVVSHVSPLNDILWVRESFVAVGNMGVVVTSKDGLTWKKVLDFRNMPVLYSLASGKGTTIIVGGMRGPYGSGPSEILIARDGLIFEQLEKTTDKPFIEIEYMKEHFYAIAGNSIYRSKTGKSWSKTFQFEKDLFTIPYDKKELEILD